jgi:DNA-binding NarL/FixJ family response regulator
MITAHDGAIERKQALEGGVDLFLPKPLNRKLINDAIDKVFDPEYIAMNSPARDQLNH